MNADTEIAMLQLRVQALEGKLSEAVNSLNSKVSSADARAGAAQQSAQQALNWQQTLRGTQGVTVRGNVIEGPPQTQNNFSEGLETGCLNGVMAAGMGLFSSLPAPVS